ncbi:MAG: hypothetical protein WC766_03090 [Patescibacteria group bacterium]
MRLFILALAMLAVQLLAGCTSYTRIHNGRPEYQSRCGIGGYSCTVETNDQIYPTAQAKYGQMPGNLQDGFAVQEAVADHQRTMNNKLYGGYGWGGYGGWGRGYYPMMLMPPAGGFYTAPPLGSSSYFPSYR